MKMNDEYNGRDCVCVTTFSNRVSVGHAYMHARPLPTVVQDGR